MKFKEIEFKYAANIKMSEFERFCSFKNPVEQITARGFDYFYENKNQPDAFFRHRKSDRLNQLTFKRKLKTKNNIIRTEYNLDLKDGSSPYKISNMMKELGYSYRTAIFKRCVIYVYEKHVVSLYSCSRSFIGPIRTFLEIEANEEYPWNNETQALDHIKLVEKEFSSLGISPKKRLKKSLFEIYKEEA